MVISELIPPEFLREDPWLECNEIIHLSVGKALPDYCYLLEGGIPQKNPDHYFHYRFDLLMESESALRGFLGFLVDFRQIRKLTHFLLGCCDLVEISYDKNTGTLRECRFRMDFSDRISIIYSTRMCGCIVMEDGKEDTFHAISIEAIDDLRRLLAQIWESIRPLPIWEPVAEKGSLTQIRYQCPILQKANHSKTTWPDKYPGLTSHKLD